MDHNLCRGRRLLLDQACLQIHNSGYHNVIALNVSAECHQCSPQFLTNLSADSKEMFVVSTTYPAVLQFEVLNKTYEATYDFGQHGFYEIDVNSTDAFLTTTSPAEYVYAPLWHLIGTLIFGGVLWVSISLALRSERVKRFLPSSLASRNVVITDATEDLGGTSSRSRSRSGDSSPLVPTPPVLLERKTRTASLDVFRGITVTLMMFVNYGGGKYSIFEHSAWNGLTFADLVFPWFAWIMGVGLALSIQSQLRNSVPRKSIFVKVLLRSMILISLGIVLNSFKNNNIYKLRIPGVLQRLGVAFFIVGTLEACFLRPENLSTIILQGRRDLYFRDIMYSLKQWIIIACIVIAHTCVVLFTKVPGCPRGYNGPGGLELHGKAGNCTGGVTGFVDRMVFGDNHIYQRPTSWLVYRSTVPFDPEGLLGSLTTSFNVFLGAHAAHILIVFATSKMRNIRWLIFSILCAIATFLLTTTSSKNEGLIPINKNLWSLSFVTATSGLAFLLLVFLYTIVDEKRSWSGSPFREVGRNAVLLYVGHIVTKNTFPWNWSPIDHTTHAHALWMNAWSTVLWMVVAIVMDRCQVYITI